ncbi:pentatricopeptide repeat-containing protein At1g80270, mitochondrial-like isoform X2 [Tripterygium wilfordii]|uniref:pentatricopeptide repeat-containing protein At1g80270, mitochondrial-like isoform X2 n=1 Tax=Tripterygium wilfordii TaxID=458696 RepID=UPI0018F85084|nr:pentatricopeptide repeat-containing protein At1g80270, mitochondrial-like isoform X2 [Tripterygium wilfordii]
MWTLRRASNSFRKHGQCIGISRGFSAKVEAISNDFDRGTSNCSTKNLVSRKWISQKQVYFPSVSDEFFVGTRSLCSHASASVGDDDGTESRFAELGESATAEIDEKSNAEDIDREEPLWDLDFVNDTEKRASGEMSEKKALQDLLDAIVKARGDISEVVNKWVQEGNNLGLATPMTILIPLRKQRMLRKALQFLELLEGSKQYNFKEHDYASCLDLITLLVNCVRAIDRKKAEAVFNRMKELKLPNSIHCFNQMIILYRRLDRIRIADILQLMEKENVEPSVLTYKLLIETKGESGDIKGMEQLVEAMKAAGIEPDAGTIAILAKYYVKAGLKDRAESLSQEVEERNLKGNESERKALLLFYASLGKADEVGKIWDNCKLEPKIDEFHVAIEAWGRMGKIEEAEAVFEMMLEKWTKISSRHYSILLNVYVNHKLLSKGQELIKRMSDSGCRLGRLTWHALVRLNVEAGLVAKADSILQKATQRNQMKPLFKTCLFLMEQYAKQGDVHNTQKLFDKMRQYGYGGRIKPFEVLIQAYVNSKTPAYGFRERLKADNLFPNKTLSAQLARVDAFRENAASDLLD